MAFDISNKALRGSISQILLNALISGDKYGYEICKDIEQKSNGKLLLKQPSLYSSLRRMENRGLISSYWADSDLGGRRHYYSITAKGRTHYERKQLNWNEFGDLLNALPTTDKSLDNAENDDINDDVKEEIVEETTTNTETKTYSKNQNKNDFGVVKQEDLFSLTTKKIKSEENISSGGETFIQFDMFDQKPNFIKTTNNETNDVISTFKSKYSTLVSNAIEPDEPFDDAKQDVHEEINETYDFENDIITDNEDTDEVSTNEKINDVVVNNFFASSNTNEEKDISNSIVDNSSMYKKAQLNYSSNSFVDKQKSEKYVPVSGKFAYTKDSDNIYGGDFREIENASLKGSLNTFFDDNEDDEPYDKLGSVITPPETFDELLDSDEEKRTSIEDVIPTPKAFEDYDEVLKDENPKSAKEFVATSTKAFDEYDEVLKDDERIVMPHNTDGIKSYNSPDEYNPMRYVDSNEDENIIKKQPREYDEVNYKNKIANLYSDTSKVNPYNKPLEEERVSLDSEEIFESNIQERHTSGDNNLASLKESFNNEGIRLRVYNKTQYTKKSQNNYVNLSGLTLAQGWIVWLFMAIEIICTGIVLNASQLLPVAHLSLYYWAFGLSFIYPIYYTIMYIVDPYKKIISSFKFSTSIFHKFLAMLITIVFIFALNLFFGMTSLNQLTYLSYWLLPIILTTNYIISTLIYFILLKGKKFSN